MPDCQASAKKNHVPVVIVKSEGNVSAETIITSKFKEGEFALNVDNIIVIILIINSRHPKGANQ